MNKSMNKGFTLIQVIGALTICLVLSTVSVMAYQKVLDQSRMAVCMTNQQALLNALIDYDMENAALPAVLGDLKRRHFESGFALALQDADWTVKVAHFAVEHEISTEAYAGFLTYESLKDYGVTSDNLSCPSDVNGGISYGINKNVAGKSWAEIADNVIVIGDCDSALFDTAADLRNAHYAGSLAVAVRKDGQVVTVDQHLSVNVYRDGDDAPSDDDPSSFNPDFADNVANMLDELETLGLPVSTASAYQGTLGQAIAGVNSGDVPAAIDKLEEFIAAVEQDVSHGDINESDGAKLITFANQMIGGLNT